MFPELQDEIVQVEKLSKKYGQMMAVNGVSSELPKGEVFTFLSPNGAGKTNPETLECLGNPTGGRAKVVRF